MLPESQYVVVNKEIPVQNGQIAIRVLQPLGDDHTSNHENTTYPALVWFHGGGERVPLPSQESSLMSPTQAWSLVASIRTTCS